MIQSGGRVLRRARRVDCVALSSAVFAACTSTSAPAVPDASAGAVEEWRTALTGFERQGIAVYSFRFDGAPPGGAFYTLGVHATDVAAACRRYGSNVDPSDRDFWFIDVTVNDLAAGEHAISSVARDDGKPSSTADVRVEFSS